MAYQPKSYRKFVATAATATLVASAVVPVASAASFTDVNSNYTEAVNYLVENNIAKGISETEFGTDLSIKRGDAAVMIANAIGLDTTSAPASSFTDLNDRVRGAVNALYAEGIINGKSDTQFAPDDNITRAEMAKVIALAYGFDGEGVTNEFTDVNSSWDQYVDALVKNGVTLGITEDLFGATQDVKRGQFALFIFRAEHASVTEFSYDGEETINLAYGAEFTVPEVTATVDGEAVEVTRVITDAAGKEVEKVDTKVPGKYTVTYTAANGDKLVLTVNVAESTAPEVVSVSATNLKQATVAFNQPLDKKSAETEANYTFPVASGLTVTDAKVSGNNVVLTVEGANEPHAAQQQVADLTVKNVKAENGVVIADTTTSVKFIDTAAPTVQEDRVVGPRKVELTFSEPLEVAPTVKLDNGSISTSVQMNADRTKATVIFGVEPTEGTHSLEISGGSDYAGFKVDKVTREFNYAKDTTAPTVTVSDAEPDQVTLKFNKPVSVKSLANVSVYHTINNSSAYAGTNLTAVDAINGYSDTYTVDFNTPMPEGNATIFLNTKENAFEDEWGNDVATQTLSTQVVLDKVAPTVLSVVAEDESEFTVKFSENVKENNAEAKANYVLTDKDGKTVSISGATLTYDDETYEVTFTNLNLAPGAYTLTVKNIEDTSFSANKLVSQAVAFSVPDSTPWTISNEGVVSSDNTKIRVTFDEAMSTEGLATLSNYALYTAGGDRVAFPSNSSVVAINNKTVEIRLGAPVVNLDAHNLRVAGLLKDAAGNGYSSTQYVQIGLTSDELTQDSLVANSAKTKTSSTLVFQLNQELSGSLAAEDFELTSGKVVGGASYVNNDGKATVTLTLASGHSFDSDDTDELTIDTEGITNTYGTKNAADIVFNIADGLAPSVTKDGDGNLVIADNTATAYSDFVITFNEVLGDGTALAASDLVLTEADGDVLVAGDDYTVEEGTGANANKLIVTLANDEYVGDLTVASVANPVYIRDAAGNRANAFAATTVNVTSTVVASAAIDTEMAKYNDKTEAALNQAGDQVTAADFRTGAEDATVIKSIAVKTNTDGILTVTNGVITHTVDETNADDAKDGTATLTITFTKGGVTKTKDVILTVTATPAP